MQMCIFRPYQVCMAAALLGVLIEREKEKLKPQLQLGDGKFSELLLDGGDDQRLVWMGSALVARGKGRGVVSQTKCLVVKAPLTPPHSPPPTPHPPWRIVG